MTQGQPPAVVAPTGTTQGMSLILQHPPPHMPRLPLLGPAGTLALWISANSWQDYRSQKAAAGVVLTASSLPEGGTQGVPRPASHTAICSVLSRLETRLGLPCACGKWCPLQPPPHGLHGHPQLPRPPGGALSATHRRPLPSECAQCHLCLTRGPPLQPGLIPLSPSHLDSSSLWALLLEHCPPPGLGLGPLFCVPEPPTPRHGPCTITWV